MVYNHTFEKNDQMSLILEMKRNNASFLNLSVDSLQFYYSLYSGIQD